MLILEECTFLDLGCDWKGPRCNLPSHLEKTCEHNFCSNKVYGCVWEGTLALKTEHESECSFSLLSCRNSHEVFQKITLLVTVNF